VVKNKVAAPFRQAEFDIEFGRGISTSGCILDLALEHNVVAKSGSFFSYDGERLGQGRNNAKVYLDEHPEVAKEIEVKIYAALGLDEQGLVVPIESPGAGESGESGASEASPGADASSPGEPSPGTTARSPASTGTGDEPEAGPVPEIAAA